MGEINIVDLDFVRAQSFNFLNRFPEYAGNVIELVEEVEKDRDRIYFLQAAREEDSKIIQGLINYLRIADELGREIEKFIETDNGDEVAVFRALKSWKDAQKKIEIVSS